MREPKTKADCLFCKIVAAAIPVPLLYEDAECIAFADINPQAPVHMLVIPKDHIDSHAHTERSHAALFGHLMSVTAEMARMKKLANGYRIVINTGADGGQTVDHLHVHLLGGRAMQWPPG